MRTLRVGLVGLGVMGRHHCRVLRSLEGVELVAVADPSGDPHGVATGITVVRDAVEMLAENVDYCVIAVPAILHEQVAVQMALAGVHALIEKPLANTVESAGRIARAFSGGKLVGGVGHVERYNPAALDAKSLIDRGELGQILQVASRRQSLSPSRDPHDGVIMDLGIHDFDLTRWLTGAEYKSVSAQVAFQAARTAEGLGAVLGCLTDGVIVSHMVNWLATTRERTITVVGEGGVLSIDTGLVSIEFARRADESNRAQPVLGPNVADSRKLSLLGSLTRDSLRAEHEDFRNAVLGRPSTVVSLDDGISALAVAESCLVSAGQGGLSQAVTHYGPGLSA